MLFYHGAKENYLSRQHSVHAFAADARLLVAKLKDAHQRVLMTRGLFLSFD